MRDDTNEGIDTVYLIKNITHIYEFLVKITTCVTYCDQPRTAKSMKSYCTITIPNLSIILHNFKH